ncbi:hypothetical protein HELRODRAFT_63683, partial [Helobdella robusta]|uniref:Protein C10 n=1 Tax=Helobdella robusta TaxID=6412 RepID=T1FXJ0_HELRO
LSDILSAFKNVENEKKMKDALDDAGNDMLMIMQFIFPIATKIQMNVIPKYGFSGDGDGLILFTRTIQKYEKENEKIRMMNSQLRSLVLPVFQQ